MSPLRPLTVLSLPALLLAGGLACSPTGGESTDDTDADGSFDSASPGDTDAPDQDSGLDVPPDTLWGLSGSLAVDATGLPTAEASSLTLVHSGGLVCSLPATIDTVTAVDPLPSDATDLYVLVTLDVTAGDGDCAWLGPDPVHVGFGPSDASLRPAADRAGFDADAAYGLYVRDRRGQLLLVGLAGPQAVLDGEEAPASAAPLPEGTYRLVTLHGVRVGL